MKRKTPNQTKPSKETNHSARRSARKTHTKASSRSNKTKTPNKARSKRVDNSSKTKLIFDNLVSPSQSNIKSPLNRDIHCTYPMTEIEPAVLEISSEAVNNIGLNRINMFPYKPTTRSVSYYKVTRELSSKSAIEGDIHKGRRSIDTDQTPIFEVEDVLMIVKFK